MARAARRRGAALDARVGDGPDGDGPDGDGPDGDDGDGGVFDAERARLVGLAYRMLGSRHDAEDVVQDAWIRWQRADRSVIDRPAAWLTTVVSRVALDTLRARRRERTEYVGPWLPEPVVLVDDVAISVERRDTLRLGFVHLLERLSPRERVAYVLAEVFDEPHAAIGEALGDSAVNSRQLVSRARRKLAGGAAGDAAPAVGAGDPLAVASEVVSRLLLALAGGDRAGALVALAPEAVLVGDGGAEVRAARHPVRGADRVLRFLAWLAVKQPPGTVVEFPVVNGEPAMVARRPDGRAMFVMVFTVRGGVVAGICNVVNPAKLAELERPVAMS